MPLQGPLTPPSSHLHSKRVLKVSCRVWWDTRLGRRVSKGLSQKSTYSSKRGVVSLFPSLLSHSEHSPWLSCLGRNSMSSSLPVANLNPVYYTKTSNPTIVPKACPSAPLLMGRRRKKEEQGKKLKVKIPMTDRIDAPPPPTALCSHQVSKNGLLSSVNKYVTKNLQIRALSRPLFKTSRACPRLTPPLL